MAPQSFIFFSLQYWMQVTSSKERTWARFLFLNASKFGPFTDTPLLKKCLNGSLFSVQCGLALNLKFLPKEPRVAVLIQQLLCPDRKSACFNTSRNGTYQALGAFIYELSKYVLFFWRKTTLGRRPLEIRMTWQLGMYYGYQETQPEYLSQG